MEIILSIIFKVVSIILMLVFLLSVALLIVTFRKPRKVSMVSQLITIGVSLICLLIFSLLIHYDSPPWLWVFMVLIGGGIGVFWSKTTKVFVQGQGIMSRSSIWYLMVWGGMFALNQLITIVTNRPPGIAMAMLIMGTAVVWGTSGSIMVRYLKLKPALYQQSATPAVSSRAREGSGPGTRFCSRCGNPAIEGDRFCRKCGAGLS